MLIQSLSKLGYFSGIFMLVMTMNVMAGETDSMMVDGDALLRSIRERLPRKNIMISGCLKVIRYKGVVAKRIYLTVELKWDEDPPVTIFNFRDDFNTQTSTCIAVVYRLPGSPECFNMHDMSKVDIYDTIAGTDVRWMDLSLGWLWYTGSKVRGIEYIRGRKCYVVDLEEYNRSKSIARLWIDSEIFVVLQAQFLYEDGTIHHLLKINGVKKIEDCWIIKEMEIIPSPLTHIARFTVESARIGKLDDTLILR